jgi:hypothetical protein
MLSTKLVEATSGWLEKRVSRRGFLRRTALAGSAVAVSGLDYVLRPGTAYASVCGSGTSCASGWTAMCCTVNDGINQCPPGSFAGGWWKADGASLCGGKARYYIDCQARCTGCGCGGGHFCGSQCWNCKSHCASGSCDQRRVCTNVFRYGQCHQEISCSGPVWCRAISCTPPWKWESCSTSSATDDNTTTHSAPCLPNGWTAIMQRYTAMGSQASVLGTTIGGERDAIVGRVQVYTNGRMYWLSGVGAHFLTGDISDHYLSLDGTGSPLGVPTTDEHLAFDGRGHLAHFQHGSIYQAPGGAAHAIWGALHTKWKATGYAEGVLGYPTTDNRKAFDGQGDLAHFEHGSIYDAPGSAGPHAVWGPVHDAWAAHAYAEGPLGYPTTDTCAAFDGQGSFARFQNGSVYWAPGAPTAHAVWGPLAAVYAAHAYASGPLGYLTTDVTTAFDGKGSYVHCQHGAIYDSPTPGVGTHAVWGPIYDAWAADGDASSRHGYPTTDVQDIDGGQQCGFEHDIATWTPSGGVVWTPR